MSNCKDCIHFQVCDKQKTINHQISQSVCKCFKDKSLILELPCKVGDYVEWVEGRTTRLMRVKGFRYNLYDLKLRYLLDGMSPIISHPCIKRTTSYEEVEQALKKGETIHDSSNTNSIFHDTLWSWKSSNAFCLHLHIFRFEYANQIS